MSRISASAPRHPAPSPATGSPPPTHVPIANDGGIEGIVLELEQQSRRSRELRNDARDAHRDQQAKGIQRTRKSARLALAGGLVQQAASAAAGLAQGLGGRDADQPDGQVGGAVSDQAGSEVARQASNAHPSGSPGVAWTQAGVAAANASGTLLEHFAGRATTRAEVAGLAAETYEDVADDAAQAEQDATRMAERALQHLDAILTARRDAEAAILRG